jgi:integrase
VARLWGRGGRLAPRPAPPVVQRSLGLLGISDRLISQPARRLPSVDGVLETFRRRLTATGASAKTQQAYGWQMRQLLATAHRRGLDERDSLSDLFQQVTLLGQALADDRSARQGTLSRWTIAQRRAAVRAFARLMAPELRPLLAVEPEDVVIAALRLVAEHVGGGYRLTGGTPRRRGGRAPTLGEVKAIIAEAGRAPGFKGKRNTAFFALLHESGSRVNALREIEGRDIHELHDGRLRLLLHAKGRHERREVEVSERARQLLVAYIDCFNGRAADVGRAERIGIGAWGPFWRSTWGQQWAYANVAETFDRACLAAGTHAFTCHALRRAFASDAASVVPRHVVAQAGGWQGLDRLDNHYIQTRVWSIARKLGYGAKDTETMTPDEAAAHPV